MTLHLQNFTLPHVFRSDSGRTARTPRSPSGVRAESDRIRAESERNPTESEQSPSGIRPESAQTPAITPISVITWLPPVRVLVRVRLELELGLELGFSLGVREVYILQLVKG